MLHLGLIDTLSSKIGFEDTPQRLELMERINSGEMPPEKEKKRPSAAESAKAVEWIAARMTEAETARNAARGRVSYNRITRDEYVNTIRNLLGVQHDAKDPGAFLDDPERHGFERLGSVLTLSPSNIEKHLAAVETQINENHRERLRKVGMFAPDKKLYPDYDKHLENSMIAETTSFFYEVLHGGHTLRELLKSDWSMMNARLADFCGLADAKTKGDEFVKVSLPAESHRGGLLAHASILALTSDGTRHRPVHRGVWVMESICGKSPPPPPANVDPIATNPAAPKAALREKLEAHIHDANCAGCHAKIDPLGLAFENDDAIGRWRTPRSTPPANSLTAAPARAPMTSKPFCPPTLTPSGSRLQARPAPRLSTCRRSANTMWPMPRATTCFAPALWTAMPASATSSSPCSSGPM